MLASMYCSYDQETRLGARENAMDVRRYFDALTCWPQRVPALVKSAGIAGIVGRGACAVESTPVICSRSATSKRTIVVHKDLACAYVAMAGANITYTEDQSAENKQLPTGVQQHVAHHGLR